MIKGYFGKIVLSILPILYYNAFRKVIDSLKVKEHVHDLSDKETPEMQNIL